MFRGDVIWGLLVLVSPSRHEEKPWVGKVAESGHMGNLIQVVPRDDSHAFGWFRCEHLRPATPIEIKHSDAICKAKELQAMVTEGDIWTSAKFSEEQAARDFNIWLGRNDYRVDLGVVPCSDFAPRRGWEVKFKVVR